MAIHEAGGRCSVAGCPRKPLPHGLCSAHRQQLKRLGYVTPIISRFSVVDRFWAKVNKDGPTVREELGPCWEWTASRDRFGYGVSSVHGDGSTTGAHRASWVITHGAIPDGMMICHRCDNPPCVRPDHLFPGTPQDNVDDKIKKGRVPIRHWQFKTHKRSRVTAESVIDLRRQFANGVDTREIARRFGISRLAVYNIVRGNRWGHIPDGIIASTPGTQARRGKLGRWIRA